MLLSPPIFDHVTVGEGLPSLTLQLRCTSLPSVTLYLLEDTKMEGAPEDFNEGNDQLHMQNSFYCSTRNHLQFFFLIFLHMKLREESVNMPLTFAQFYAVF